MKRGLQSSRSGGKRRTDGAWVICDQSVGPRPCGHCVERPDGMPAQNAKSPEAAVAAGMRTGPICTGEEPKIRKSGQHKIAAANGPYDALEGLGGRSCRLGRQRGPEGPSGPGAGRPEGHGARAGVASSCTGGLGRALCVAVSALDASAEKSLPSLRRRSPGTVHPGRIVAHVSLVPTGQVGDPVARFVLVIARDRTFHPRVWDAGPRSLCRS